MRGRRGSGGRHGGWAAGGARCAWWLVPPYGASSPAALSFTLAATLRIRPEKQQSLRWLSLDHPSFSRRARRWRIAVTPSRRRASATSCRAPELRSGTAGVRRPRCSSALLATRAGAYICQQRLQRQSRCPALSSVAEHRSRPLAAHTLPWMRSARSEKAFGRRGRAGGPPAPGGRRCRAGALSAPAASPCRCFSTAVFTPLAPLAALEGPAAPAA